MTKPMGRENLSMVMARFMMEIGNLIRLTGMANTLGLMAQGMLVNGKTINKKGLEEKLGQTVLILKEISLKEQNKGMEY